MWKEFNLLGYQDITCISFPFDVHFHKGTIQFFSLLFRLTARSAMETFVIFLQISLFYSVQYYVAL